MLGDIQIAEPGALIGLLASGDRTDDPRKLPEGFQRAEYLLDHGIIDMVISRGEARRSSRSSPYLAEGEEAADGRLRTLGPPGRPAQLDAKLSPAGDRLGLERIDALLARRPLAVPATGFHVAGTNGRFDRRVPSIGARTAGHKSMPSPAPTCPFNERIRIAATRSTTKHWACYRSARRKRGHRAELLKSTAVAIRRLPARPLTPAFSKWLRGRPTRQM
jgi:hypothetical protein